jgi:hypothetical protein
MNSKAKLKNVIFALFFIIAGIVILYFNNKYNHDELFLPMLNLIATSIITSALFSIIMNIFSKNYFENELQKLISKEIPFMFRLSQKGLVEYEELFPLKKDIYENDFIKSKSITIVMNDAKKFYSNNITLFRSRFSQKNKITNIILLDPESKDSISVLTRKNSHEGSYYKDKINSFIDELLNEQKNYKTHKIKVCVHNLYTTMAVVLTDKYAMVSLYRISPGKDDVPHFIFEKNQVNDCEYKKIYDDIKRLLSHSKEIKRAHNIFCVKRKIS